MPDIQYTSQTVTANNKNLAGGLNSTSGPLALDESESSDLQNIDFNKFGSILKRNGYTALNTVPISTSTAAITAFASASSTTTTVTSNSHGMSDGDTIVISGTTSYNGGFTISASATNTFVIAKTFVANDATGTWYKVKITDGLHWYEAVLSGTLTRFAVKVAGAKLWKMDALDGTWDDITGALTITSGNHCDFENWLNEVYITNNADVPFKWAGSGNGAAMTVPANLTKAKFVRQFNNYLFLANVTVSGTVHQSRVYYSNIKTSGTWTATDFIEISKDDGQEITGLKVLSDRLVIFKSRSIYNMFFTGDNTIPFILPGGGKSNSAVGCNAYWSIQEVENGLVFLSFDGFYYYDGNNSYKISDKITATLNGYNTTRFTQAVSSVHKSKNRYFCSLPADLTTNSRIVVWDYFNNSFSIYLGLAASAMSIFYVSGLDERPHFSDYSGFTYRMDTGADDYPLNIRTAIDAYYYTNWKAFEDLSNQKQVPNVYIYFQLGNAILTFAYSYDFQSGDTYTQTFSTATAVSQFDISRFDVDVFAGSGGGYIRQDLASRGRVVRLKFSNSNIGETFQVDGIGMLPHLESKV